MKPRGVRPADLICSSGSTQQAHDATADPPAPTQLARNS
jgi:hypothetical protein